MYHDKAAAVFTHDAQLVEGVVDAVETLFLADEFEQRYVSQGNETNRSIEETLTLGWELLSILPTSELKRVKPEQIEKYMPKKG